MDLIGSELCKTFQFCEVRTPPGGLAPAGPSPRFARFRRPPKIAAAPRPRASPLPKNASPFPALGRGEI